MSDEELLENLTIQIWAICCYGGDQDLGTPVAAQMHEVCDPVAPKQGGRRVL